MRYAAAAICGALAVFYVGYFFVVDARETAAVPHVESMAPVFLLAAALYLVGAVLLGLVDRPRLWIVGAVVQLLVVGLYLWNGVHDVWNDVPWAIVISMAEAVVFGLLAYLALDRSSASDVPATSPRRAA